MLSIFLIPTLLIDQQQVHTAASGLPTALAHQGGSLPRDLLARYTQSLPLKWRKLFMWPFDPFLHQTWRPHGLQPTRLLCPWDFPGKSTGVGCHYRLQNMKKEAGIFYLSIESLGFELILAVKKETEINVWSCFFPLISFFFFFWRIKKNGVLVVFMTLIIKLLSYCSCLCGSLLTLSILQFLTYERHVEWSRGGWREKEWERKTGKERELVQYLLHDCKMRTWHFLMADSGRSDQALTDGLEWNVCHHTCGLCISSSVYMYTCIPVIHVWSWTVSSLYSLSPSALSPHLCLSLSFSLSLTHTHSLHTIPLSGVREFGGSHWLEGCDIWDGSVAGRAVCGSFLRSPPEKNRLTGVLLKPRRLPGIFRVWSHMVACWALYEDRTWSQMSRKHGLKAEWVSVLN